MTKKLPLILAVCMASPVIAEETRQLDAHEHGVGQLDIAIEGNDIAMELHAPGADIVGFEYEAESAEDLAAIETAKATLSDPLSLFQLPEAAGCRLIVANAELEVEEGHDDHDDHDDHEDHKDEDHDDHDDHKDEDHDDHDDHKDEAHDDHDHDDHKDEDHDDHAEHDEHKEEGHDHDDHDEHAEESGHTEFHADYILTCSDPSALTKIDFAYFEAFPNALEVEVQIVSDKGASAFEVERDEPSLELSGF